MTHTPAPAAEGETTVTVTTKPGVLLGVEEYNALRDSSRREIESAFICGALTYCIELLRDCPANHESRPLVDEYVRLVAGDGRGWFRSDDLPNELQIARDVDAKMRAEGDDPTGDEGRGARFRAFQAALLAARADAGLRRSLRDDALCVSQWFEDAWTGDENEPVYQAAVRLRAALAATPEGTDHG